MSAIQHDSRPGMSGRRLSVVAMLAVCGAFGVTGVAEAAGAETKVTIKAEGTDLFGFVKSPNEQRCADDRKVKVFKKTRDGKMKIGTDNASLSGNRYRWSLGNTGLTGRFYARVGEIPGCQADRSETIRVQR